MNTKTLLLLGAVVVGAGAVWFVAAGNSAGVPVDAEEVRLGPIREFVDERAVTRLPETYLITMPSAGRIEPIDLAEGTPVSKGQEVARIVPRDLDLTVQEATAVVERLDEAIRENADTTVEETAVEQALQFVKSMLATVQMADKRREAGLARADYAERHLGDVRQLVENNRALSQDDLERAYVEHVEASVNFAQDELVFASTEALKAATDLLPTMIRQYIARKKLAEAVLNKQKAEAEARLRQIIENQQRGTMTSPIDGVVLARHITNERFLSGGTALLEIGRMEDLEIEADILSLDVVEAQPGDPVEIYGPAIGEPRARGTVSRIYPGGFTKISSLGVEQQRVKVVIDFDPEDLRRLREERSLGVGYRVRVRITTAEKSSAMLVPRSSLFRGADGSWRVYVVEDGVARVRQVSVGMINDELAEVTSNLQQGDLVIRAPESDLTDGQRVEVQSN